MESRIGTIMHQLAFNQYIRMVHIFTKEFDEDATMCVWRYLVIMLSRSGHNTLLGSMLFENGADIALLKY